MGIKFLQLEPTNICNLNCKYCNRVSVIQSPKSLSMEEVNKVISYFDSLDELKFQGLGEPFILKNSPVLLDIICNKYPNILITTATNLNYNVEDSFIISMLSYLNNIYFSIDGIDKIYEFIRQGSNWKLCLKMLEKFSKLKLGKNKFIINFVASKDNYLNVFEVANLLNKYPIDEMRVNIVQDWSLNDLYSKHFNNDMVKILKEVSNIKGVVIIGNEKFQYKDCKWVTDRTYIDSYGNLGLCCINTTLKFGNVFETNFYDLYNDNLINIRECILNNKPHKLCVNCSYIKNVDLLKRIKL